MTEPASEKTLAELAPARYECLTCGYVYEPSKGDSVSNIPAGTLFEDLPASWRCPVCSVSRTQFKKAGSEGAPSGFQENLKYGLGVNQMTPGQKNLLIFGGLFLAFLFFMSFYAVR